MSTLQDRPVAYDYPAPPSPRHQWAMVGVAVALVGVAASLVVSVLAWTRPMPAPVVPHTTVTMAPSAAEVAAAKDQACTAWMAGWQVINDAHHAWVVSTPPDDAAALVRAQAVIAVELPWVRQHVPAATPPELSAAIDDFGHTVTNLAGYEAQANASGQANVAVAGVNATAEKIRQMCA